jgi:hypothetical protein
LEAKWALSLTGTIDNVTSVAALPVNLAEVTCFKDPVSNLVINERQACHIEHATQDCN